jgi:hypothetical protein
MRRRLSFLLSAALLAAPALPSSAAGGCTSGLPVTDPHAAQYDCPGVHPGMALRVHSAKYGDISCGASFAFTDQLKQKYLTLPGTCFLDFDCLEDVLEELPPPLGQVLPPLPTCTFPSDSELEPFYKKNGPAVKNMEGDRIGSLVYAVNKQGVNFAIARLDPGIKLDPSLPLYGGPVRLGAPSGNTEEAHVYSATAYDVVGINARSGVLHAYTGDRAYVLTEGFLSMPNGASVLRTNGEAVGLFTGTNYVGSGYETQPFGPALARTRAHTGLKLTLLTAPLA